MRRLKWKFVEERLFLGLMLLSALIVVGSLCAIVGTVLYKGFAALNWRMLVELPRGGYCMGAGGGILNAIAGSLVLGVSAAGLALALSLPVVLYLNVYLRRTSRLALLVRFVLDVLWGIPSIVYGAFGFTVMVFFHIPASLLAGSVTVGLLVLPLMARGMDEVLKTVPEGLKEAAYSLGSTRLETALKVVLRQAFPGLVTAVLIAFGRGISDAASVLFTTGFTDYLPSSPLEPVATLPLAIFFQLGTPFPEVQQRGYASALVLTLVVLAISIVCRIVSKRFSRHVIR